MADYMESANKINTMAASAVSEGEFKKVANKVSFITIVQNVLLSVFKLFAGIFAHSNAMISDAVHSASDVFSTIIVIIGVKLASKESDKEHPYGHERLECVAAIVKRISSIKVFLNVEGVSEDFMSRLEPVAYDYKTNYMFLQLRLHSPALLRLPVNPNSVLIFQL